MSSRILFSSILMVCLMAIGFLSVTPEAKAASAGQSFSKTSVGTESHLTKINGYDRRGYRIVLPIVPYIAYDYAYEYSRGRYPTHIGPGYIYNNYHIVPTDDYDDRGDGGHHHAAKQRCADRFRSFEWDTGLYTTYRGPKRLCPYLR